MNRKQFRLAIIVMCASSMFGGGLAGYVVYACFARDLSRPQRAGRVPTFEEIGRGLSGETQVAEVIEAKSFRLVDEAGRGMGAFMINEDGYPELALAYDRKLRLVIGATEQGSILRLFDDNGNENGVLSVRDGAAGLRFNTAKENNTLGIVIFGEGKQQYPMLLLDNDNGGGLMLCAQNNMAQMKLYYDRKKQEEGKAELLAIVKDQDAILTLGSENTYISLTKAEGKVFVLTWKDGKPIWSSPLAGKPTP